METENVTVRRATMDDCKVIVDLVEDLLTELGGFQPLDDQETMSLCRQLIQLDTYIALIATNSIGENLGLLTLTECNALYVGGQLGWVQELYVTTEGRSQGVGHRLIATAEQIGVERGWKRLEVNTPDREVWSRTVSFYNREGLIGNSVHLRKLL